MKSMENSILSLNCGSSSIKFAVYNGDGPFTEAVKGEIESIGTKTAGFTFTNNITHQKDNIAIDAENHDSAGSFLVDWLEKQINFASIIGIGHRIVHGIKHTRPELITPELTDELKKISVYDPEHLPDEIRLAELFSLRYPAIKQVACFDTAFHTSMPQVAKMLAIPRRYQSMGIQRYGFHGLSYTFLMEELKRLNDHATIKGNIILAHLGNGASLAAVKDGTGIDTSMGFSPSSGLPMSTRTGDLDPGVATYLMRSENISPEAFNHLVNYESGLLGVSETSADMRKLLQLHDEDHRAAEAIELFCYQVRKWIGSFTAVLEGIDILVFAGGIGEHAPEIRSRICNRLGCMGIELDEAKNRGNDPIISSGSSKVCVRVIKTNEELTIARMVYQTINHPVNT